MSLRFKKKKKNKTRNRQGLCHALRLGVRVQEEMIYFLIVQLSDLDSIFLSHEGNN